MPLLSASSLEIGDERRRVAAEPLSHRGGGPANEARSRLHDLLVVRDETVLTQVFGRAAGDYGDVVRRQRHRQMLRSLRRNRTGQQRNFTRC